MLVGIVHEILEATNGIAVVTAVETQSSRLEFRYQVI